MLVAILTISALAGLALLLARTEDAMQAAELRSRALQVALSSEEGAIVLTGQVEAVSKMVPSRTGLVFIVDGLEQLPKNRTYQLWLLREDNSVVTSRVFKVIRGIGLVEISQSPNSFDRVAVTVEPQGGSPRPSSDPILASK